MNASLPGGFCSDDVFLLLLVINGILAYLAIQSRDRLIKQVKEIEQDLYRAILFPRIGVYEADFTGMSALFFYSRFRKAVISKDFHALNPLRSRITMISVLDVIFLGSVLCSLFWWVQCA